MLYLGSDHAGLKLKQELIQVLDKKKIKYIDLGTNTKDSVDYPDYAKKVSKKVQKSAKDKGILICGTGIGMSIAANRFKGIRATLIHDSKTAKLARQHNNSNILVLGGRNTKLEIAKRILNIWLTTKFEGGRHKKRLKKLN